MFKNIHSKLSKFTIKVSYVFVLVNVKNNAFANVIATYLE